MRIPPHPLFGSRRSFLGYGRSVFPPHELLVLDYLSRIDPGLSPLITYQYGVSFLTMRSESDAGFYAERSTVERLTLWALIIREKKMLNLNASDAEAFLSFIQDPPGDWTGGHSVARFVRCKQSPGEMDTFQVSPGWRPFDYGLLPKADGTLRRAKTACISYFDHLNACGITDNNPFRAIRSSSQQVPFYKPFVLSPPLSDAHWEHVLKTVERLANENPSKHERTLFLVAICAYLGLTAVDLIESGTRVRSMSCFVKIGFRWEFHLISILAVRKISVPPIFVRLHLRRYSRFLELPLPFNRGKYYPIIPRLKRGVGLESRAIMAIAREAFDATAKDMVEKNRPDAEIKEFELSVKQWIASNALPRQGATSPKKSGGSVPKEASAELAPYPLFDNFSDISSFGLAFNYNIHDCVQSFLSKCSPQAAPADSFCHVRRFLYPFTSEETFNGYRKYSERVLLWSLLVRQKPVIELTSVDLQEFLEFCRTPPDNWVRTGLTTRFLRVNGYESVGNHLWRPFQHKHRPSPEFPDPPYVASRASLAGQMTVCALLFEFLHKEQMISESPLANKGNFRNYSHPKKPDADLQTKLKPELVRIFVNKCRWLTAQNPAWARLQFVVETIQALRFSLKDIEQFGFMLRFKHFQRVRVDQWIVICPSAEGIASTRAVPTRYMEDIVLPYRLTLGRLGISLYDDDYPVFATQSGRPGLSTNRIRKMIHEVALLGAQDIADIDSSSLDVVKMRALSINDLCNADL